MKRGQGKHIESRRSEKLNRHFAFRNPNPKHQITNKSQIPITPMHLTPQQSLLPLETMSQFAEPVIPDESAKGRRDPESSESSI